MRLKVALDLEFDGFISKDRFESDYSNDLELLMEEFTLSDLLALLGDNEESHYDAHIELEEEHQEVTFTPSNQQAVLH